MAGSPPPMPLSGVFEPEFSALSSDPKFGSVSKTYALAQAFIIFMDDSVHLISFREAREDPYLERVFSS